MFAPGSGGAGDGRHAARHPPGTWLERRPARCPERRPERARRGPAAEGGVPVGAWAVPARRGGHGRPAGDPGGPGCEPSTLGALHRPVPLAHPCTCRR
ncbi:hypothetical protein DEH18_09860 [Streptomyces sp. NHF165]|nr:hypothetical protein DEH18_09860 [Streptomyces sp. NHF165]